MPSHISKKQDLKKNIIGLSLQACREKVLFLVSLPCDSDTMGETYWASLKNEEPKRSIKLVLPCASRCPFQVTFSYSLSLHLDIHYSAFKNKNSFHRSAEMFLLPPPSQKTHLNILYKLTCLENVPFCNGVQYSISNQRLPFAWGTDTALLSDAFIPSLKKSPEEFSVWTYSVIGFFSPPLRLSTVHNYHQNTQPLSTERCYYPLITISKSLWTCVVFQVGIYSRKTWVAWEWCLIKACKEHSTLSSRYSKRYL